MQKTFLLQDENIFLTKEKDLKIVTKTKPTTSEIKNLLFANQVCKHVKSNAIVICNKNKTLVLAADKQVGLGLQKLHANMLRKIFLEKF